MIRKISLIYLFSLTSFIAQASDYTSLIEGKKYSELKSSLYKEQPNVLDRKEGYSILDYAIAKKDKRAAIIIADYNNSSLSQRKLKAIEIEISELSSELKNTQYANKEIPAQLKKLIAERDKLKIEVSSEYISKVEEKLAKLEEEAKNDKLDPVKTKLDLMEKQYKERLKELELDLNNTIALAKSNNIQSEENSKLKNNIKELEKRISSLEGQLMPIELKNATLESRAIFDEEIDLSVE
ncbi:HlyD family secretion protein [Vibrio hepatarius]|uniref:HlyD family secretion protein n=1 Tax=Vibrio hepatarius TaxID=171383 RepID=UPI001C089FF8|nr:HlyD family secretion protein [Vibrio hepatarius]MBU2895952.1 HlyD family secretion protein [Vibrio hepatarius]